MRVLRQSRAWAAACVAGALLAGAAAMPLTVPPAAATGQPSQAEQSGEEAPEQAAAELELLVAPEDPIFAANASEVRFTVLLRNDGERSVPEGSVELAIGERFTGESALARPEELATTDEAAAAESEAPTQPASQVIATATLDAVPGGKTHTATVTVPVGDVPAFTSDSQGVYPLYATYRASDSASASSLSAFSPVVWGGTGEATASVNLTTIVPLTFPANVHSMPTRNQLEAVTPTFSALVDYATRNHAVLAIDPRFVTAVRSYGVEAPEASRELLARLESTALTNFLLQFADADPAAQAALGAKELLQPAGFEFVTRFGAWEPAEPAPTDPTADDPTTQHTAAQHASAPADGAADKQTAPEQDGAAADGAAVQEGDSEATAGQEGDSGDTDPEPAPAPTDEQLAEWPSGLAAAWPAPGQVGARTLSLLRASELNLAVLRSDNVTLAGGPRAKIGSSDALVTDAELDAAVQLALTGQTETERALGSAQTAARLALAATSGTSSLVLGVDRAAVADTERPEEVLAELTHQRWVKPVAYASLPEGTAKLAPAAPNADRLELLEAAIGNEATVLEARAMLVNPEYLNSYQRMRLLNLLATKGADPAADFAETAAQFAERDAELHDGVRIVGTKRAQLVGGSTRIPIQLRNSLPFDAIVTLQVSPTSAALRLPERSFPEIVLPEDSSERVLVPANSRVSSGDSALLLAVTSVDGEYTASSSRLEVTISSAVETVAIAVLASAAALLFGFGIWRSVRRRRTHSPRE